MRRAGSDRNRRRRFDRHERLGKNEIRRRLGVFHLHDFFRKSVDDDGKLAGHGELRQQASDRAAS